MKGRIKIADEQGTTLVELMVATAAGLVVVAALCMVILVSLNQGARVSARVHATQNARIAMAKIMGELHSACVAPKITPIQEDSSGTLLKFIHGTGSEGGEVAPKPVLSEISLSEGVLSQTDYALTNENQPWVFSETQTPPGAVQLATNIAPVPSSSSIFTYYAYSNGALSETPLATPLKSPNPARTVEVRVALSAAPSSTPATDSGAAASIQNSAVLRLTPPSYNELAESLPCQ